VTLEDDLMARGGSSADALLGQVGIGLVGVKAQLVYDCDHHVERTPKENDPSHGDIVGSISGSFKNRLAAEAVWLIGSPEDLAADR
jgi:hypothetical protein